MAVISLRARRKFWGFGLAALVLCFAWFLQLTVLSLLPLHAVLCSLPLLVTIVWGCIFGSPLQMPRLEELRNVGLGQIVTMQALSGSVSGALVGAFFAALYASILPVYPLCYPLAGWVAGYFCLRNFQQGALVCIPLVLLLTVFAETAMAGQILAWKLIEAAAHSESVPLPVQAEIFQHLVQIAVPEAIVNAILSPFVFYPMRAWYEFANAREQAAHP